AHLVRRRAGGYLGLDGVGHVGQVVVQPLRALRVQRRRQPGHGPCARLAFSGCYVAVGHCPPSTNRLTTASVSGPVSSPGTPRIGGARASAAVTLSSLSATSPRSRAPPAAT